MNALPVLLIIASQGYQPIEYSVPKRILGENGIKVVTASNKPGTAIAKDGSKAKVDITLDQVKPHNYAGVFIVGGPGALENLDNETTYNIIRHTSENKKPFGAICISTRILAKAGVLKDKKVTGWNGDDELPGILKKHKAIYIKEKCVVDMGNGSSIITATDPSAAQAFGNKIIEVLSK
ncbi:DJ-1/PfpI family protein [Candidatus Dependentiae bacterium]